MRALSLKLFSIASLSLAPLSQAHAQDCKQLKLITSADLVADPEGRYRYIPVTLGKTEKLLTPDFMSRISTLSYGVGQEVDARRTESGWRITNSRRDVSEYTVEVQPLTIGRFTSRLWEFLELPDTSDTDYLKDKRFAGGLGYTLFRNHDYDVDIDFARNRFHLLSPDHCAGAGLYWQPITVVAIPFKLLENQIVLNVLVDGVEVVARIDPFNEWSTIDVDLAVRKLDVDMKGSDLAFEEEIPGRPEAKIYRRAFKSLSFEGITVNNPMLHIVPEFWNKVMPTTEPTGSIMRATYENYPLVIGYQIMSKLHVYIAYSERLIYLSPKNDAGVVLE